MPTPDAQKLLTIYLDDHWAGAGAGRNLAYRLRKNNADSSWAPKLDQLISEIEDDHERLRTLRTRLGADGGQLKRWAAVAAERAARLKPNGRVASYSPLSRLIEIEAMQAGVSARQRLWAAMQRADLTTELSDFDFERLEERAAAELEMLRAFHDEAADVAFGAGELR